MDKYTSGNIMKIPQLCSKLRADFSSRGSPQQSPPYPLPHHTIFRTVLRNKLTGCLYIINCLILLSHLHGSGNRSHHANFWLRQGFEIAAVKSRKAHQLCLPTPYHNNEADKTAIPRHWGSSVTFLWIAKTIQVIQYQINTTGDQIRLSDLHPLILFG